MNTLKNIVNYIEGSLMSISLKVKRNLIHFIVLFLTVLTAGTATAFDTEVYFSNEDTPDENARSNVLFILDTSGSMGTLMNTATGWRPRFEVLRDSMETILRGVNNINIGLMAFNSLRGGNVVFPITYINAPAAAVPGETSNFSRSYATADSSSVTRNNGTVEIETDELNIPLSHLSVASASGAIIPNTEIFVRSDQDDAFERTNGALSLTQPPMFLRLGNNSQYLGLRFVFPPGRIPRCSDIDSATLTLNGKPSDATDSIRIQYGGQLSSNTIPFAFSGEYDISSRPTTTPPVPADITGEHVALDVGNLIKEIVRQGDCSGDGSGGTWDGNSIVLIMEYLGGASRKRFLTQVPSGVRDSTQTSGRLEITYSDPPPQAVLETTKVSTAIRFENVNIPQGAAIREASICFTSSAPVEQTTADLDLRIYVGLQDNAPAPDANGIPSDIADPSTVPTGSTYAGWRTSEKWDESQTICIGADSNVNDSFYAVPLEVLLAQVINRPGWCAGNALTILIEPQNNSVDPTTGRVAGGDRYIQSTERNRIGTSLDYQSDVLAAGDSCFSATSSNQLIGYYDNANEDPDTNLTEPFFTRIPIGLRVSGFRFNDIELGNLTAIRRATLSFFKNGDISGENTTIDVRGELAADGSSEPFARQINNISNRSRTTQNVSWTLPPTLSHQDRFEVDVTDIVDEITSNSNWVSGNPISFTLNPSSGNTAAYNVYSFIDDETRAALLSIEYQSITAVVPNPVRDRLIELTNGLEFEGSTPIEETMYEAAHYWRGEPVVYGSRRGIREGDRLSHPGSYCTSIGVCPGAITGSGVPGNSARTPDLWGVISNNACPGRDNLADPLCVNRNMAGTPRYIPPFQSDMDDSCSENYQILLTDGRQADPGGPLILPDILAEYGSLFTQAGCYDDNDGFRQIGDGALTYTSFPDPKLRCIVDMAEMLNTRDQSPTIDGVQNVKTYTIAFAIDNADASQLLRDIANRGGGEFRAANNAVELTSVFEDIISDIRNSSTSFAAPSISTNAFNRLLSRDDIYFGLFNPDRNLRWSGNVKKFKICLSSASCRLGQILDVNGNPATDSTTNRFLPGVRSFWSSTNDGSLTTQGGAGAEITDYYKTGNATKIYTEQSASLLSNGESFNKPGHVYEESNSTSNDWAVPNLDFMRGAVCSSFAPAVPVTPSDPNYENCRNRMQWLLGKKKLTRDDDVNANQRWTIADVLHSSPIVITYGGSDTNSDGEIDTFFDKLVYTTNGGALHMLNPNNGQEDWRYMPRQALDIQLYLYDNPEGRHPYSLDSTPTIDIVDRNGNSIIEPGTGNTGDTVHLYMGQRRGGENLYSLDLTGEMQNQNTEITPKYRWRIAGYGGSPGYDRLGNTWSKPVVTTIRTNDTDETKVVIFGGGYDYRLDSQEPGSFGTGVTAGGDNRGNAIFIANAKNGSKILSISSSGSGADIEVPDMRFSIPSEVTVLDSDGDSLSDRLYVGDTAGQVWRVDIGSDIKINGLTKSERAGSTVVGRLANISGTAQADWRRFFEPPSVVQVRDTQYADGIGEEYDYIMLGSGYRPHPLNTAVSDRFYAFRDTTIDKMKAMPGTNLAENYPFSPPGGGSTAGIPLSHNTSGELVDVSTQTLDDIMQNSTSIDVGKARGWYLDFDTINGNPGEKVLSSPVTLGGTVAFTTYVPENNPNANSCTGAQIGFGRAYNLNVLTTRATLNWDASNDPVTSRHKDIGGGIPSNIVPVFTQEGVIGIVNYDNSSESLGQFADLPRFRTYWYDES